MKPRIYIETTIPSYLVARRSSDLAVAAKQIATDDWWNQRSPEFDMFVSDVVLREVSRGDAIFAAARLEAIRALPVLELTEAAIELTERFLSEQIIPAVAADDAAHVAIAAAHGLQFLLTWNCKHINNRFAVRRIEGACAACGLTCPVIATPLELMNLSP